MHFEEQEQPQYLLRAANHVAALPSHIPATSLHGCSNEIRILLLHNSAAMNLPSHKSVKIRYFMKILLTTSVPVFDFFCAFILSCMHVQIHPATIDNYHDYTVNVYMWVYTLCA